MNKGLIGGAFLMFLLTGCAISPPPPEEILRQLAADAAGKADAEVAPATSEDAAAMQHAAIEVDEDIRRQQDKPAAPAGPKTDYEMLVTAPHSMAGIWRMTSPTSITIRSGAQDQYGGVHAFLCRVDQSGGSLRGSCLPTRAELSGTIRADAVDLGWASTVISARIAGRLMTQTDFAGTLSLGVLGVKLTGGGIPLYAVKLPSSMAAPPEIDEIAARQFAALGAVRERLYLGAVDGQQGKPSTMYVYDVEFEGDWKLCGFTREGDGEAGHLECR